MAKYKKRKDGRYLVQVQIGVNSNGKPQYKNIYARTIPELEKKERDFKQNLEKGIIVDDRGLTVEVWSRRWLEFYKGHLQHNTIEMYRIMIEAHIIPAIGNMKLRQLKTHHIQELINSKLKSGSTRTAEKIKLTLNQIIRQAIVNEYIYKNIMLGVEMPKKTKPQKRALSDEEIQTILSADFTPKEKAFVHLLLYTGLRRGEILALSKNDIDLRNKTLSVNKAVFIKGNNPEIKDTPKTEAGIRNIPIPDGLADVLHDYLYASQGFILFPSSNGNWMTHSAFRKFWGRIIRSIEISASTNKDIRTFNINNDITPHTFRHTYATMLYYSEIDIKTAQYLLGHASAQITIDIYTHLDKESAKKSGEKINKFISGRKILMQ